MKLSAFKELLLRKVNDEELKSSIIGSSLYSIRELLIESLEKMAKKKHKGNQANESVTNLAASLYGINEDEHYLPNMIRNAIGHHASRYKKALELNDKDMIDRHARAYFKLLDLAHTLAPHSGGSFKVDAPSLQPWERNIPGKNITYAEAMANDPEYKEKVLNWHKRPDSNGRPHKALINPSGWKIVDSGFDIWREQDHAKKKGWDFLRKNPDPRMAYQAAKEGHRGAYPMERVKINNRFIPISEVENLYDENQEHPFDKHPILKEKQKDKPRYKVSIRGTGNQDHIDYDNEMLDYLGSDHYNSFYEKLFSKDPEHLKKLESTPGAPVHGDSTVYQDPSTIDFKSEFKSQGQRRHKSVAPTETEQPKQLPVTGVDKSKIPSELHDIYNTMISAPKTQPAQPKIQSPAPGVDKSKIPNDLHDLYDLINPSKKG